MNKMLKLRGQFKQKKKDISYGPPRLSVGAIVSISKIDNILNELDFCSEYWKGINLFSNALISIEYVDIVPKSRRISNLFSNYKIVGVKFNDDIKQKHIITYYIEKAAILKSINKLQLIRKIIQENIGQDISNSEFEQINFLINFSKYNISESDFLKTVVDISNINKVFVMEMSESFEERRIVSIFETEKDTKLLLNELGIDIPKDRIRNTTLLLDANEINKLIEEAPYLIAMEVEDLNKMPSEEVYSIVSDSIRKIKNPSNEPIIGVIDTPFNEKVYFNKWVESFNLIENIVNNEDYKHGTGISSIIVDGPNLNPFLDDECGNFRVRHFGVSPGGKYSSFKIVNEIEKIVKNNPDIKVWNLSLGSEKEIEKNFISPEGSILDEIQHKYDVIFIVAGTNMPENINDVNYKIGAPADSINSVVVNPVDKADKIASYARKGEVLSFYVKPDICYYGGDKSLGINVCNAPSNEYVTSGTSYAAPWIARKLAYLIHILGFSKEEAKAILIDSCEKWNEKYIGDEKYKYGHGIVPVKMSEVISTPNDEIKFVISGVSLKYDTYNYQLPIPLNDGKYPFAAKATLCYFPKCDRNQGVDYTNTEFELKIGRLKDKIGEQKYSIDTINNDLQDVDGALTTEEKARREFRKWDNTKCIKEKVTNRDKKSYSNPLWGISITTKNRLNPSDGEGIKFGLVVTLKEYHGVNRISEFIQMCSFNQWFTEEVDLDNKLDIYNEAENEINFE